jgi:hypothetical protein
VTALHIADHPVTEAERHDVLLLLGVDDEPGRNSCSCACGCSNTSIGGGRCQDCTLGDCLFPEAAR